MTWPTVGIEITLSYLGDFASLVPGTRLSENDFSTYSTWEYVAGDELEISTDYKVFLSDLPGDQFFQFGMTGFPITQRTYHAQASISLGSSRYPGSTDAAGIFYANNYTTQVGDKMFCVQNDRHKLFTIDNDFNQIELMDFGPAPTTDPIVLDVYRNGYNIQLVSNGSFIASLCDASLIDRNQFCGIYLRGNSSGSTLAGLYANEFTLDLYEYNLESLDPHRFMIPLDMQLAYCGGSSLHAHAFQPCDITDINVVLDQAMTSGSGYFTVKVDDTIQASLVDVPIPPDVTSHLIHLPTPLGVGAYTAGYPGQMETISVVARGADSDKAIQSSFTFEARPNLGNSAVSNLLSYSFPLLDTSAGQNSTYSHALQGHYAAINPGFNGTSGTWVSFSGSLVYDRAGGVSSIFGSGAALLDTGFPAHVTQYTMTSTGSDMLAGEYMGLCATDSSGSGLAMVLYRESDLTHFTLRGYQTSGSGLSGPLFYASDPFEIITMFSAGPPILVQGITENMASWTLYAYGYPDRVSVDFACASGSLPYSGILVSASGSLMGQGTRLQIWDGRSHTSIYGQIDSPVGSADAADNGDGIVTFPFLGNLFDLSQDSASAYFTVEGVAHSGPTLSLGTFADTRYPPMTQGVLGDRDVLTTPGITVAPDTYNILATRKSLLVNFL